MKPGAGRSCGGEEEIWYVVVKGKSDKRRDIRRERTGDCGMMVGDREVDTDTH